MSETLLVDSTSPHGSPAVTVAPTVGQRHEDDVAERVLRVVGDAEADAALRGDVDPLVLAGVAQVLGGLAGHAGRLPAEGHDPDGLGAGRAY